MPTIASTPIQKASTESEPMLLRVVLPAFLKAANPILEYNFSTPVLMPFAPKPPQPVKERPKTSDEDTYKQINLLYQKKQYEKAASELLKTLTPHQNTPEQLTFLKKELHLLIRTLANQGNLNLSLEWCEKGLKADKLDPILYYLISEVQTAQGAYEEAIKSLKRALFLDPNFVAAQYMLGMLEQSCGRSDASRKAFKAALDLVNNCDPDTLLPGTEELTAGAVKDHLSTMSWRN
jgi:chemotaxis protein methyltransferase CheR